VPTVLLPPTVVLTDQVTLPSRLFVTVTKNCCVPSTITEAVGGETETTIPGDKETAEPPQEDIRRQKSAAVASKAKMAWSLDLEDAPNSGVLM
jgi:hypothetical protein